MKKKYREHHFILFYFIFFYWFASALRNHIVCSSHGVQAAGIPASDPKTCSLFSSTHRSRSSWFHWTCQLGGSDWKIRLVAEGWIFSFSSLVSYSILIIWHGPDFAFPVFPSFSWFSSFDLEQLDSCCSWRCSGPTGLLYSQTVTVTTDAKVSLHIIIGCTKKKQSLYLLCTNVN